MENARAIIHTPTLASISAARRLRHWSNVGGLLLADVVAFALAHYLFRFYHAVPTLMFGTDPGVARFSLDVIVPIAVVFFVIRFVASDYSRRQPFWDGARGTTMALLVAAVFDLFFVAAGGGAYSLWAWAGSWSFLLVAIPVTRQIARLAMSKIGIWDLPTVLLGSGQTASEAYSALYGSLALGLDVRRLFLDSSEADIPENLRHLPQSLLTNLADAVDKIAATGCSEVVIAVEDLQSTLVTKLGQTLVASGIGVTIIPPIRGVPLFGATVSNFFGKDVLLLQMRNNLDRLPSRVFKRAVDIVGSAVLLIALLPLFAVISILIKRDDGGPVFFVQSRVGRNRTQFKCIKFRTMKLDAEAQLMRWKDEDHPLYREYRDSNFKLRTDPRVTRTGNWLRRTSLDELPQLVNIILGEMSLVGPRPLLAREIPDYGPSISLYQQLRPGLTGLWQISGRADTQFSDRVAYDEWYVLNWAFWFDVVIVLKTAWMVFRRKGAY